MKVLVINTGSSSIKFEMFDAAAGKRLAGGMMEKIGEASSIFTYQKVLDDEGVLQVREEQPVADHASGLNRIVELLTDETRGVIRDKGDIDAVGHRVVHGGETFHSTVRIDGQVLQAIRENCSLAPLHNPSNLKGIEVAGAVFPHAPQVAVFDTAFHQTLPPHAYLYAIPRALYEEHRVRRYGFHGASHAYVAESAVRRLGLAREQSALITIHLGNGASMAAVKGGECVDTTMGMTPLEGLVMGTRCGDIDPALPFFLAGHLGMTLVDIDRMLNKESGLKGLCGANDMREVLDRAGAGDEKAQTALEIYAYRIKKYIGAYMAVLGRLDAIVFTAGIGENAPLVRSLACQGLEGLGISVDPERNAAKGPGVREISPQGSAVKVLVIPTREEWAIALETRRLLFPE